LTTNPPNTRKGVFQHKKRKEKRLLNGSLALEMEKSEVKKNAD
jgi:hypothetical protein